MLPVLANRLLQYRNAHCIFFRSACPNDPSIHGRFIPVSVFRLWPRSRLFRCVSLNEFYVRGLLVAAELRFPAQSVYLNTDDPALPDIVQGKAKNYPLADAAVPINASDVTETGDVHGNILTITDKEVKGPLTEKGVYRFKAFHKKPSRPSRMIVVSNL